jgi:ferredoxin
VPARIGKSLLQAAQLHKIDLEGSCHRGGAEIRERRTDDWVEETFGEGPMCAWCHVQIPSTFNHLLPELQPEESKRLEIAWEEEYTKSSRLACMITLEKKHDGMVVFIPDAQPVDVI